MDGSEERAAHEAFKKALTGPQQLQLKALKDELRAAEGTVMELKRLIAEIENG